MKQYCPNCGTAFSHTKFPYGKGYACCMPCVLALTKPYVKEEHEPEVKPVITYDAALKGAKRKLKTSK